MAASRMVSRLTGDATPAQTAPTSPIDAPVIFVNSNPPSLNASLVASGGVYRSVRSTCGHVARHLPNLWKMGRYYLEGRFDPRNYTSSDKGKEELQAHPQREEKEKVDKTATVRVFFSDESTAVRVDSRKTCGEIVDICLRRVEGDHSPRITLYEIFYH